MKRTLAQMLNDRLEATRGPTLVGLSAGQETVILHDADAEAEKNRIFDEEGRPEYNGYLYDRKGNVVNDRPFDEAWMKVSFALDDLLQQSSNYRFLVVMAGKMGFQSPTRLLDPIELRELERLETQIREAMKKQRTMNAVDLEKRTKVLDALEENLKKQRKFIQLQDTLETLFGPTAQRWGFLLEKNDPFWMLTRRIAPTYLLLNDPRHQAKLDRQTREEEFDGGRSPLLQHIAEQLHSDAKHPAEHLIWSRFFLFVRDFLEPKEDLFETIHAVRTQLEGLLRTHVSESSLRNKDVQPLPDWKNVIDEAADATVRKFTGPVWHNVTNWPELDQLVPVVRTTLEWMEGLRFLFARSPTFLPAKRVQYFWTFVTQHQPNWSQTVVTQSVGAHLVAAMMGQSYRNTQWSIAVHQVVPRHGGGVGSQANMGDIYEGLFFLASFAKNTTATFPVRKDVYITRDAVDVRKFIISGTLPAFFEVEILVMNHPELLAVLTVLSNLPMVHSDKRQLCFILSVLLTTALLRSDSMLKTFMDEHFVPSAVGWNQATLDRPWSTDLAQPGFFGVAMEALVNVVSVARIALFACFREMVMSMFTGSVPDANTAADQEKIPTEPLFRDMAPWRSLWEEVLRAQTKVLGYELLPRNARTRLVEGLEAWKSFQTQWALGPIFAAHRFKDKTTDPSYPQWDNEVSLDYEKFNMLNLHGMLTPLDDLFVTETKFPQLRFLHVMVLYHNAYMPKYGPVARKNAAETETAINEAQQGMAKLASNTLLHAQANVNDLIKALFLPSQAWSMQAKLTGRVKLSATLVAAALQAETMLKHYLPDLYASVPMEVLTCETNRILPTPAAELFLSDFTDLISYCKQQVIDLNTGQRYNTTQQHQRPNLVLQNIADRLRSYRVTPVGGGRWQVVKI